jgi:S1-C subfamily serine protease
MIRPFSRHVHGVTCRANESLSWLTPFEKEDNKIAGGLGLKNEAGVVAANVLPGSPAALAHAHSGHVIQQVNKKPVKDVVRFIELKATEGVSPARPAEVT